MSSDQHFVNAVYDELFKDNFNRYQASLNSPPDNGTDPFARARNALASLDDAQRSDVINFLKVVISDSACVILGTLDGVHFPGYLDGEFLLSCDGEEVQGDLMDTFIGKAQDNGVYE
ncbi:hypothetical protein [Pseudomonas sp. Irchel 3A5]|uniref:hypothetical protein n=1 Tax=Pseudomonas sp. Irchel 3A5 TaxID=2008911 RepID=UPI000BA36000|nr:hypothetical protein [Pseudomonas sp. Irchel 3A5]